MTVPDRRLLALCQRWLNGSGEDTAMQTQELLERLRLAVNTISALGLIDFALTPTFNGSAPIVNPLLTNLLFSPDNTLDIGAAAATRARDLFLARNAVISGLLKTGTTPVTLTDAAGKILGLTAALFASLDASALTALNATQLTTGTVPDARFPATLPAASGVNLTALNAANLASGIVPDARMVGVLLAAALGAVGTPGHTFTGDLDTGMYQDGADGLAFATGGTKALGIDSTRFIDSPTQPRCVAFHSTTQSVSDSVTTTLLMDSEDTDVSGMHSTSVNTSRVTVPVGGDGFYAVIARAMFAANATGTRQLRITKNGGGTPLVIQLAEGHATIDRTMQAVSAIQMAAGDYFEIDVFQSSGGNLNVGIAGSRWYQTTLIAVKLW